MNTHDAGLLKTVVVSMYAIVGGMTLNDWSVLLGLVLVAVRLPVEVSNLHDWYVRKFKEPRRRRKEDRDDAH